MTKFLQAQNLIVGTNGEVVDQQDSPIVQVKKLNGQGSLYKLTDANFESINAQRKKNATINVDKFIRSLRSQFGVGNYTISALTHMPLLDLIDQNIDLGLIRVEIFSKVTVTETQYQLDKVESYNTFLYWPEEGAVLELDSWYGLAKKEYDDGEVGDEFMELCNMVMEQVPNQTSKIFDDTMFDQHLDGYDKISVVRERIYNEES